MQYLTETKEVSLVVDTNAYTKKFMKESTDLFKPLNPALYVFISPDSVYEVIQKTMLFQKAYCYRELIIVARSGTMIMI